MDKSFSVEDALMVIQISSGMPPLCELCGDQLTAVCKASHQNA